MKKAIHFPQRSRAILILSVLFWVSGLSAHERKIGLLLVNHGSRSLAWRNGLLELERKVRPRVVGAKMFADVRTAFMEYTEPSIATRLKEFDAEGYAEVVMVPVFLTVSPHSFDDIPTIIGHKDDPQSREMMRIEHIERYTPRAKVTITPLLDFTEILEKNVLRRAKALSKDAKNEGLVMIAYGDSTYEKEWGKLFARIGEKAKSELGIQAYSYGWCGHIAHYDPQKTVDAIQKITATKRRAVVVPALVAFDETFQLKIVGGGVEKARKAGADVVYKPDAILPDKNIEDWVVSIATKYRRQIAEK